jgi:hypothetical protein
VSPQAGRSPTLARGAACEGAAPRPATTPPRLLTRTTGNNNSNSSSSNSNNSSNNSSSSRRPQDSNSNNSAPTSRAVFVGAAVVAAHGEYCTLQWNNSFSSLSFISYHFYLILNGLFVSFISLRLTFLVHLYT